MMLNYAMPLRVRPKIMFVFPHHSTSLLSAFLSFLMALKKFLIFFPLSKLIRSTRFISGGMSSACDMSARKVFFNEYQIE